MWRYRNNYNVKLSLVSIEVRATPEVLPADPEIPDSRPVPPRFGRENSRDFPDPDWAGIGKILGILP